MFESSGDTSLGLRLVALVMGAIVMSSTIIIGTLVVSAASGAIDIQPTYQTGTGHTDVDIDPTNATASSTGPPNQVIAATGTTGIYLSRDNANAVCETSNSTKSSLLTPLTGDITVRLKKVNAPTGNVVVDVKNSAGSTVHTFGTRNATTLTTNFADYTFSGSTYTPSVGDSICVNYTPENSTPATITTSYTQATSDDAFSLFSGSSIFGGSRVVTTTSILYGKTANAMTIGLKKTGSPTGTVSADVRNSTGSVVYTFGTIDASKLSTSNADYTFINPLASHTFAVDDRVGVTYSGGDTSNKVQPAMKDYASAALSYDTGNTTRSVWNGASYTSNPTGNDLRMTISNYVWASLSRYAVALDGTNDYVALPTNDIVANGTSLLSGAAFVKQTGQGISNTRYATIIGNLYNGGTQGFNWQVNGGGSQSLIFYSTTDNTKRTFTMNSEIPMGKWTFIGFVYNGTAKTVRFFQDNNGLPAAETNFNQTSDDVEGETRTDSSVSAIKIGTNNLQIGHRSVDGSAFGFFQGQMDGVRLWNTSLTDNQMLAIHDGTDVSSNLLLSMDFNTGSGTAAIDASSHHLVGTFTNGATFASSAIPDYVLVSVDQEDSPTYDLTDILSDTFHGDKSAWLQNWINHPSMMTTDALTQLKNTGYDTILMSGVTSNWNDNVAPYSTAVTWINLAKSMGFKVEGVAFEQAAYCNSTAYNGPALQDVVDGVVATSGSHFDRYWSDVECEGLSDWTSHKAAYGRNYMNAMGNITAELHSLGKTHGDWIGYGRHADQLKAAGYTNGIGDIPTDLTQVANYNYDNSTVANRFKTVLLDSVGTGHVLVNVVNVRFPARNLPTMPAWEYIKNEQFTSALHDTYSNQVYGISTYFYGYEGFGGNPGFRYDSVTKSPIVLTKYSYGRVWNGTSFERAYDATKILRFDLVASLPTTGSQSAHNAAKSIDGFSTYWESRTNAAGVNIYADLGATYVVHNVRLYTEYGHVPTSVKVYVCESPNCWGVSEGTFTLNDETGWQTIQLSTPATGDFVKLEVSSAGSAPSVRLEEFDVDKQTSYTTTVLSDEYHRAVDAKANASSMSMTALTVLATMGLISILFGLFPDRMRGMADGIKGLGTGLRTESG